MILPYSLPPLFTVAPRARGGGCSGKEEALKDFPIMNTFPLCSHRILCLVTEPCSNYEYDSVFACSVERELQIRIWDTSIVQGPRSLVSKGSFGLLTLTGY